MFIRTLQSLEAAGMVKLLANGTRSARYLTAGDRMGFSFNDNDIAKGGEMTLWYKNHWEANYIVSGRGDVTDLSTGETWPFEPGMLYVVGPNDRHRVRTNEEVHLVSVFCPPLQGHERHDADGGYEASVPGPQTARRMFVKRASEMRLAGRELVVANGRARTIRMLTKSDDLGFGFSDVHFTAGADTVLWYKHHWEANHILDGTGEVTDLTSGTSYKLEPGVAYNVGPRDRHRLRATTDLHLISIFCPAPRGDEQHDEEGTLPPSGPVPPGPPDAA
jgi:mannose-6-phosphate isomerase-like protein (cupin superfamily)